MLPAVAADSGSVVARAPLLLTGCIKPFDKPEFVEIDTSETGFLIPLEGDTSQQAKFQSEDYLRQRKVAAKRVQILHRWSQEGRLEYTGRWIPTVRLVKVNAYEHTQLATRFGLFGVPAFVLFRRGKVLGMMRQYNGREFWKTVVQEQAVALAP